ncbi:MAG TPA: hypothetical protein VFF94_00960, partial [Novosphingobium sp.]|nr:hypothetical protein [Novosphingobium sp.]
MNRPKRAASPAHRLLAAAGRVGTGLVGAGLAALLMAGAPARADVNTDVNAGVNAGAEAWSRGDFAAAVHAWQGPAETGDAVAQYNLGQAYKFGKGVPQDLTRAEMLFAKAAAQGHAGAADQYGLLLFQRGQHAQAMPYIRTAADRGEPRAQYLLGVALFNGDSIGKDWVRAYALELLANQAGLPQARAALAQMDQFVPLDQRQKGVSLAGQMQPAIESSRNRQTAAELLGADAPPP